MLFSNSDNFRTCLRDLITDISVILNRNQWLIFQDCVEVYKICQSILFFHFSDLGLISLNFIRNRDPWEHRKDNRRKNLF
jgi:hypothetical protein